MVDLNYDAVVGAYLDVDKKVVRSMFFVSLNSLNESNMLTT